ncbi:MAG: elongation factor-1 alpha [Gallionella sp.]|nr:elongation factor-1 alpha [Gallionella sp.]MDP1940884.1 elongation factor-1 alpha [Gallionella sp.]
MIREIQRFILADLALPIKTLFTGYLLVVGLGLLFAGAQILLTHGMADGKLGLSVDDIVYSYHGQPGTKLEAKLNGSMKDMAPPEVRLTLIKWASTGAPEEEWETTIKPHVEQYCAPCHANMPNLINISDKTVMDEVTKTDGGVSVSTLTRVSHIHLFGISFIFFFVGWIFTYATGFSPMTKGVLIFTPFGFLIVDVLSWWLTKLEPNFAWLVIVGGFGYSLAATVMIFTSLYQMWILPRRLLKPVNPLTDI